MLFEDSLGLHPAGTPPEQHVLPWFIEDRSPGSPSYSDWANALHKAAMAK